MLLPLLLACAAPTMETATPEVAGAGLDCPGVALPDERPADGTPLPEAVWDEVQEALPALDQALAQADEAAVHEAVCSLRQVLGEWQGVAEIAGEYRSVDLEEPVDARELLPLYAEVVEQHLVDEEAWTSGSTHGSAMTTPLRVPCETVAAYLSLHHLGVEGSGERARQGADWLVEVQGAQGQFPFPDLSDDATAWLEDCLSQGHSQAECESALPRHLELALRAVAAWESLGRPEGVLEEGWFVDLGTLDPGGLQLDTGICGRALVEASQILQEPAYLEAARQAGAWARAEQPVSNWNYNGFSVGLMAELSLAEPEADWADAALARARLGVLPGAMADGRWFDPHNARITYHHVLLADLARLARTTEDPWVHATLEAAVLRSTTELREHGATGLDDGMAAHLIARDLGLDSATEVLVRGMLSEGLPSSLGLHLWLVSEL